MRDTLLSMATEIARNDSYFKIQNKGQMIVILSRTKYAKDTIFVGDKNNTLAALKDLLTRKTQQTDYMEEVLSLIIIDLNIANVPIRPHILTQALFPYQIYNFPLPQYNTGYMYILILVKDKLFTYIGQTMCIQKRI